MAQKLMIFSDVHDDIDALEAGVDYAVAREADRILVLGDLSLRPYTAEDLRTLAQSPQQPEDIERFLEAKRKHNGAVLGEMRVILDGPGIPFQVIHGNYDSRKDMGKIFKDAFVHDREFMIGMEWSGAYRFGATN